MSVTVGHVSAVWRYPVKSMLGERVASARLDRHGLLGDRAFALRDVETGTVASAKHPTKWGALLQCRAAYVEAPRPNRPLPDVLVTLPSGEVLAAGDPRTDARLSDFFRRAVTLVVASPEIPIREADRAPPDHDADGDYVRVEPMGRAAPPGSFVDYAPVHLITTSTLRALAAAGPASAFDARRFRANLVLDTEGAGFVENAWLGRVVLVGDVGLEIFEPCPRCVVTTLAQDGLPRDRAVLRTIAASNAVPSHEQVPGVVLEAVAGVYARAVAEGTVRVGDAVRFAV